MADTVEQQQQQDRGVIAPEVVENIAAQFGTSPDQSMGEAANQLTAEEVLFALVDKVDRLDPGSQKLMANLAGQLGERFDDLNDLVLHEALGGPDPANITQSLTNFSDETLFQLIDDIIDDPQTRQRLQQALANGDRDAVLAILADQLPDALQDPDTLMRVGRTLSNDRNIDLNLRQALDTKLDDIRDILEYLREGLVEAEYLELLGDNARPDSAILRLLERPVKEAAKKPFKNALKSGTEEPLNQQTQKQERHDNGKAISQHEHQLTDVIRQQLDLSGQILLANNHAEKSTLAKQLSSLLTQGNSIRQKLQDLRASQQLAA